MRQPVRNGRKNKMSGREGNKNFLPQKQEIRSKSCSKGTYKCYFYKRCNGDIEKSYVADYLLTFKLSTRYFESPLQKTAPFICL
jgi:hypothetical protein